MSSSGPPSVLPRWRSGDRTQSRDSSDQPRLQGNRLRRPGRHFDHPVANTNANGLSFARAGRHRELIGSDVKVKHVPAVADLKTEFTEFVGNRGVEPERVLPGLDTGETALDQVNGPGHGTEVDALGRGATLDVGDIAQEGSLEETPGPFAIRSGEHPQR